MLAVIAAVSKLCGTRKGRQLLGGLADAFHAALLQPGIPAPVLLVLDDDTQIRLLAFIDPDLGGGRFQVLRWMRGKWEPLSILDLLRTLGF